MLRFGGKKKSDVVSESFGTLLTTWYLHSSSAATSGLCKRTSKYPAAVEQIATEMWQRVLLQCRRVTALPHISLAGLAAGIVPVTSRVTQPTDFKLKKKRVPTEIELPH